MLSDLDMENHKIKNLATPLSQENGAAVNVAFVSEELRKSNTLITIDMKKYVDESHISNSNNKKDFFRYLMEDKKESVNEHNIIIDGIVNFSRSPHSLR